MGRPILSGGRRITGWQNGIAVAGEFVQELGGRGVPESRDAVGAAGSEQSAVGRIGHGQGVIILTNALGLGIELGRFRKNRWFGGGNFGVLCQRGVGNDECREEERRRSASQPGAEHGYVALVDGIITRLKEELGPNTRVIGTGGQAPLISQETKLIETVDPNLTLDGLKLVASRLFRR